LWDKGYGPKQIWEMGYKQFFWGDMGYGLGKLWDIWDMGTPDTPSPSPPLRTVLYMGSICSDQNGRIYSFFLISS